jgi:PKD repeat protein
MNKIFLCLVAFILTSSIAFSQKTTENSNKGVCGSSDMEQIINERNPENKNTIEGIRNSIRESLKSNQKKAATQYTIPVVFHMLYDTINNPGLSFTEDSVFIKALDQLNKDFARSNADTNSISPLFKSLYINSDIIFMLAKKDPMGNCTSGIVHHQSPKAFWDVSQSMSNQAYSSGIVWDPTKYLNVLNPGFLINIPVGMGSIVAYSSFPGTFTTGDLRDVITGYDYYGRLLTHEVGHWLGLLHTFGNTNSPGITCGDDGLADTPTTLGQYGCPTSVSGNTCHVSGTSNVENFMNYSNCTKNFTTDQTNYMRTALTSTVSGRDNLITTSNHTFTAINSTVTCSPNAFFFSNIKKICAGTSVAFTAACENALGGTLQWTFAGGTPSLSSVSNPTITYNTPGTYMVKLKATTSAGSDSITRLNYITVNNAAPIVTSLTENFDTTSFFPNPIWNNPIAAGNGNKWIITSLASVSGTNSAKVVNTPTSVATSALVTYSRVTIPDGSYITLKHAYSGSSSTTAEALKLEFSEDCGHTWMTGQFKVGTSMLGSLSHTNIITTATPKPLSFVPTSTEWKIDTVYKPSYINDILLVRVVFESNNTFGLKGSDIYVEDINLFTPLSTSIDNFSSTHSEDVKLFPNPTSGIATVSSEKSIKEIILSDMLGRQLFKNSTINGNQTTIETLMLNEGVYFITITNSDNETYIKKLVVSK